MFTCKENNSKRKMTMLKLSQLKKSTQETIAKIAKASNMTAEKVLKVMCRPTSANGVTTHLNFGT